MIRNRPTDRKTSVAHAGYQPLPAEGPERISRATVVRNPRRKAKKRSSSFEMESRETLIQEMLRGTKLIREEAEEEDQQSDN